MIEMETKNEWCNCANGLKDTGSFFDDHTCKCGIVKHHYHCNKCGNVTQVG